MTVLDQVRAGAREQIREHKASGAYKSAYSVQQLCDMHTALGSLHTHQGEMVADWLAGGMSIRTIRSRVTTTIKSLTKGIADSERALAEHESLFYRHNLVNWTVELPHWQDVKAIIG